MPNTHLVFQLYLNEFPKVIPIGVNPLYMTQIIYGYVFCRVRISIYLLNKVGTSTLNKFDFLTT